ncbi:DUF3298 and DUF4163 domain-containing protein [Patiriisocius hiemis]|uniref:DUF4163 domain-containing protein n=1 Tax=Patiriisocius hiemis TaxID=3075604 RepID=A0ABU2YGX0_9FLAO|nr:DUF4163 domain-containing protein [Constantimarinum sp. W242]MDT0556495.1 DUF4163 domain-containing protein [Constantimarinum sp. W242]
MNNKTLLSIVFLILVFSCKNKAPLRISSESFSEKELAQCASENCPEITINYLQILGDEAISTPINTTINEFIISSLYIGDPEQEPQASTITESAKDFIKMYNTHSAEFPDMATAYFAEINVSKLYQSTQLVSLEMRNYLFTGGAHGYGSVIFKNFDLETGEQLSIADLVKNIDAFTDFAEQKFRTQFEIPQTGSINATGFWFEDDTFFLPPSIGVTNQHIIIRYNQYDIASYAAGPIEFKISRDEASDYLNY